MDAGETPTPMAASRSLRARPAASSICSRPGSARSPCSLPGRGQSSRGPVAIGGVSLGALSSQLATVAAKQWPAHMQPDGLLLVATNGEIAETLSTNSLARAIGLPEELAEHGWTDAAVSPWRPLAEPRGEPAVAPERIIMVLGTEDSVAPFAGGLALAERWGVPAENRFVSRRGHFSTGLSLGADSRPLQRLFEAMCGG